MKKVYKSGDIKLGEFKSLKVCFYLEYVENKRKIRVLSLFFLFLAPIEVMTVKI